MIPRGPGGQGRSTLQLASARSDRAVRCTGVSGPGTGTDSLRGTRPGRARLHPHAALDTTAAQARRRFPCEVRTIRRAMCPWLSRGGTWVRTVRRVAQGAGRSEMVCGWDSSIDVPPDLDRDNRRRVARSAVARPLHRDRRQTERVFHPSRGLSPGACAARSASSPIAERFACRSAKAPCPLWFTATRCPLARTARSRDG